MRKAMYGRYQRTDWHFDAGWMWKSLDADTDTVYVQKTEPCFGGC